MKRDQRWRVLRERLLIERKPWLRLLEQDVELPDGQVIEDFLKISSPAYASVFAIRSDGFVVAVEEYKHGPGRVVLKLPAGFVEAGETPLQGAKRELLEEAGYEAQRWQFLGAFFDDGNRGMSLGHHYFASDVELVANPNAGDLSTVRPVLLTASDLRQAVCQGRVGESSTAAAILLGLDALNHGVT